MIQNKKNRKGLFLMPALTIILCCSVFVFHFNIVRSADDIEDLQKKADDYRKMIELKQQQQNTLKNQLEVMEVNENRIENNVVITKKEINEKENDIEKIKSDITETEKEIEKTKEGLSETLRTYYKLEKEINLTILSKKGSLSEVFNHSEYLNQASKKVEKSLKEIKAKKEDLNNKEKELESKKEELEGEQEKLKGELNNLATEKRNKNVLLDKTKGEEAKYQKLLADVEDEIYEMESGKTVDYGNVPAAKGGYFDYPVSNVRITQGYGMTSYAKSGAYSGKPHNGIDFGVSYENIYAVRDGKVKATGNNGGYAYGRWIAIDHGDGLITLYGHLSSLKVSKGDKVDQGDKIAVSGNTGFSTGPHLHFSVFDADTFELTESKYVSGLYIPTGASINPNRYF